MKISVLTIPVALFVLLAWTVPVTYIQQDHKHEHGKDDGHNHPKEPEKIEWSAKRKLTWKDYKGTWNNTRKNPIMTFVATFYNHHQSRKGDSVIIETVPIFYPADSYVKDDLKTKEQLECEQIRFNLYEVWARKLRKEYSTFSFAKSNYSTYLQSMYKANLQARNSEILKYNTDTKNGKDLVKQKEWGAKITKQLAELEKYSKKIVYVIPK